MDVTSRETVEPFTTKDGLTIRELPHGLSESCGGDARGRAGDRAALSPSERRDLRRPRGQGHAGGRRRDPRGRAGRCGSDPVGRLAPDPGGGAAPLPLLLCSRLLTRGHLLRVAPAGRRSSRARVHGAPRHSVRPAIIVAWGTTPVAWSFSASKRTS